MTIPKSEKAHWESDQWDDHPVGGQFGLALIVPKGADRAAVTTATVNRVNALERQAGMIPAQKLNFLQKLLHFIAHPIQTTRTALHPQSTMHGDMPRMSDFGAPVNVQTGKAWYENQYDSIDWSR